MDVLLEVRPVLCPRHARIPMLSINFERCEVAIRISPATVNRMQCSIQKFVVWQTFVISASQRRRIAPNSGSRSLSILCIARRLAASRKKRKFSTKILEIAPNSDGEGKDRPKSFTSLGAEEGACGPLLRPAPQLNPAVAVNGRETE
jgi:hypothetical protein